MTNQTGFKFLPHEGAYLTGLTNPNGQSNRSLIFYHLILCSTAISVVLNFVTHVYLPGLTLECQLFKSSFHHLDLPSNASQTHSYPLTWTYLRVPVWLCFDFITHVYLIGLTPLMPELLRFFESLDLFELPYSFRRFFWSFYWVQDPFFFTLHSCFCKKTHIWCNVSCNVWLCMNEMFEHLNLFFIWICFIPLSSFLVLTNAKCKCHAPSHADEIPWLVLPMRYANVVP